jgi:SAM-dependent methyltransferase
MSDIPITDSAEEADPDVSKLYIFDGSDNDRARLVANTFLSTQFMRSKAKSVMETNIRSILDVGCGEGHLTLALNKLYPQARVVGIDIDPAAIQAAKEIQAKTPNAPGKIEYIAGDAQEKLPDGPFDLVHISMMLLHTTKPEHVLDLAKQVLKPGGRIWVKDLDPSWITTVKHPNWLKMGELAYDTMDKVGRHGRIALSLAAKLSEAGFSDVQVINEDYMMGGNTVTGRIALSVALAVLMNTRKVVSKVQNVPEEELLKMHEELRNNADTLHGQLRFVNAFAKRPLAN